MLKAGADINLPNPDGITPLMTALDNLHFDLAKYLLERGANPHTWDWWGRTPLYVAVDMHSFPNSHGAFNGPRVRVELTDEATALDVIKMLLAVGVSPNPQLDMHRPGRGGNSARFVENLLTTGATPLLRAAVAQDSEACQVLLEHGALVDLPNVMGVTPLMAAAGIGISTNDPRPLFDDDMQGRALATLEVLVKAGADVNARILDTSSHTARIARPSTMTDRQGQTAIYGPISWGWTRVAQFLLDHGAKVDVVDAAGKTPLNTLTSDIARRDAKAAQEMTALLKNAGAGTKPEAPGRPAPPG
jgi:ankyrin repeat protein